MTLDPRATDEDLTAKARIRNAALDLFAELGENRASMRAIAAEAGVTVGLVVHHFTTKAGVRDAVEQLVVDYHREAIAQCATDGTPAEVAAARNAAVTRMLRANPAVVNYTRRALLDPDRSGHLLERLTDLSRTEIAELRNAGIASSKRSDTTQVIDVMIRQLGQLFLQPMLDAMWDHLADGAVPSEKPQLSVTVKESA